MQDFNKAPALYVIRRPEQLRALASPARQELVDAVAARGPSAIGEVAPSLGRTPESLYFHVRVLEACGLLVPAGTRAGGRRPERLYRAPGRRMVLDVAPTSPRHRAALRAIVLGSLRLVLRDVARGLADPDAVMTGPTRTVYSARLEGWLTPAQRRQLSGLFDRVEAVMAKARPRPGANRCAVSLTLAPGRVRRSPRTRDPVRVEQRR